MRTLIGLGGCRASRRSEHHDGVNRLQQIDIRHEVLKIKVGECRTF